MESPRRQRSGGDSRGTERRAQARHAARALRRRLRGRACRCARRPSLILMDTSLPLTRIEPPKRWIDLQLRELAAYRELAAFLVWRDVKVRYKQTAIGAAWAVIQPVTTMVLFTIVFGRIARLPSDGVPYPLFALAGLLPWQLFASSVTG